MVQTDKVPTADRGSVIIRVFAFSANADIHRPKEVVNADFKIQLIFQVADHINSDNAISLPQQILGESLFRVKRHIVHDKFEAFVSRQVAEVLNSFLSVRLQE